MIKSNSLKGQKLVCKKIDEFCDSSAKLLESIHARFSNKGESMRQGENDTKKIITATEFPSISDLVVDFND